MKSKKLGIEIGIVGLLIATMMLFLSPLAVQAAVNELPSGIVIGDDKGIQAQTDGTYFMEVNNVLPGEKWQTELSILNVEKDVPYELTMQVIDSTWSGPIDFSTAISMKMTYDGTVIYEGPLSGVSEKRNIQKDPINLGTFYSGDSRTLKIELEMDSRYTKNDFQEKSMTDNVWEFVAIKKKDPGNPEKPINPNKPTKPSKPGFLPQTGEEWRNTLIYFIVGMFLILIVALVVKKRWDEKKQEKEAGMSVETKQDEDHHVDKPNE